MLHTVVCKGLLQSISLVTVLCSIAWVCLIAGADGVLFHSPAVSCGTASSAAASSAGSDKAWSSGSNLAIAQKPVTNLAQGDTASGDVSKIVGHMELGSAAVGIGVQPDSSTGSGSSNSNRPAASAAATVVANTLCAGSVLQRHDPANKAPASEDRRSSPGAVSAAVVKAGAAVQFLLNPSKLLLLLGLQSSVQPQQQQQLEPVPILPIEHDTWTANPSSDADTDAHAAQVITHKASQSKAQHDMLAMLGLAAHVQKAPQTEAQPELRRDPERTHQQAEYGLEVAEVLLDYILCHPEVCCCCLMPQSAACMLAFAGLVFQGHAVWMLHVVGDMSKSKHCKHAHCTASRYYPACK